MLNLHQNIHLEANHNKKAVTAKATLNIATHAHIPPMQIYFVLGKNKIINCGSGLVFSADVAKQSGYG